MEPDYCFHYARLTEAIFLQTTTCCWAQSYCSVTLGYKGLFISHVPHLLWSTTCPLTWWWEDLWGCPAATAGISLLRIKNRTMWKFWFNMTTTCDPHYTSILQRQKSTKCHNWDINSVGSPQLLLISPRLNWALPELAQETTSFLQNSKEKFKLHYCVCLVPVQELFLFEGFGNLPKQGQSLGCSSQACAQSHYTTLPLPPLKATCALGILLVFVDHMHQWPLHHLHFTASQLRPILPGSDGTLDTHFSGCTTQGELHRSLSSTTNQAGQCRVQGNSQDSVKYKTNGLVCWHQMSHSNVSWAPGKVGIEDVNSQC